MRTLLLLRHAKSSWDDPGLADEARPLAERGRRAADRLGAHLRERGLVPDRVLCSPAERTRQTAARALDQPVELRPELYPGEPAALLAALSGLGDEVSCAMLIGHNPGLEELAVALCATGRPRALRRLRKGFKTGALAEIELDVPGWRQVAPGGGRLVRFTRPKDLPDT